MAVVNFTEYKRRLAVPFVLLLLSLLALLVSLFGLVKTTAISAERIGDLQISWEAIQDGTLEGSELVATGRQMERAAAPVPAVQSAARWSLALALVSLLLLSWVVVLAIRAARLRVVEENGHEQSAQSALLKLMDEIAPLASGDLTVQATVSDSVTGSLADAFNYAITELRWLVGTLGSAAAQVSKSVEQSRKSAEAVSQTCVEQSGEIHRSSNHLLSISGAMAELSADATESSTAAQATVEHASMGAEELQANLKRLTAIHEGAAATTRTLRRLAENASAADERISSIEDAAKHIDLLALNTTIRATADSSSAPLPDNAANLGRLSDEVAQLSDVLGRATRDIGSLTRTIAQDAKDAVRSVEHTTSELAIGLEQTTVAAKALQTIHEDARRLNNQNLSMVSRIVEQSGIVRLLSENMDAINRVTSETVDGISANVNLLDDLQELAGELRQTQSDFRLPARPAGQNASDARIGKDADNAIATDSGELNHKPSLTRQAVNRAVIHE